ncbi:peptidyl-tRNA hydrolase ICT1, mitochondrial isoform X2 [Monodelphis domestica]|uniref:peptidyl-tRNA hydrolase ICT1, mitochondrial isoform X2 n=1 Tax=Monodelphis domestica TaxID=13616 RepID=UPI0024E2122C|nr:peptidyl-tRNA hydrolase ICT1, mitochondrial isoform X2 [Monodelphis domestica]
MAAARSLLWLPSRAWLRLTLLQPPNRCLWRTFHDKAVSSEFKSIYSLDKLYPNSCGRETAWRIPDDAKQASTDIPIVNTKAEVRFHLATADWIAEPVRQKISVLFKNKISKSGELIITSDSSRYQFRNLADCLQKIRDMIAQASQVPKEPSKEDAVLRRIRIENANRERLRQKRIHSSTKANRKIDMD